MKIFSLRPSLIVQPLNPGLNYSLVFHSSVLLTLASVDGKEQSVFNDAWSTSAQVINIPSQAMTQWNVPDSSISDIIQSLTICDGHSIQMKIQFKRNAPTVCGSFIDYKE